MTCFPHGQRSFVCPNADNLAAQTMALLPRGDAWATSDGAFVATSVIARFWRGVSDTFSFAYARWCALREEFWCATHSETHAEWMLEYGLPDDCDPFPDLCTKVAALGGTRCEYYTEIAARAGWSIDCVTRLDQCGSSAGCRARAGRAKPGRRLLTTQLQILVHLGESSTYVAPPRQAAKAGRLKAGRGLACGPDIAVLKCLLERVVHAEIELLYVAA